MLTNITNRFGQLFNNLIKVCQICVTQQNSRGIFITIILIISEQFHSIKWYALSTKFTSQFITIYTHRHLNRYNFIEEILD